MDSERDESIVLALDMITYFQKEKRFVGATRGILPKKMWASPRLLATLFVRIVHKATSLAQTHPYLPAEGIHERLLQRVS